MINLQDDEGFLIEKVFILRLEPEKFRFDVAYLPVPQSLEAWGAETGALIVLNGGFFREENGIFIPTGLTIVDEEVIGRSFGSFAGMFAITLDGPELRWLAQQPYDSAEPLLAALQSFPMLVRPGGELGFAQEHEDNQRARRTVIGQDRDGRLLFIVASIGTFTLHELSAYLVGSDFNLDIAINLDGGPSSGLLLTDPPEGVSALNLLPIVILVHAR
jgi:exopolysaccharide biosynthesis protein